ncbi:MAG: hypothetical protein WD249_13030 [Gaiellaceae bacterium]
MDDPSLLQQLWDNAVAGAAVVALALGIWLTAHNLGVLRRPKHWLRSTYLPPRDLVGFFAMPHFLVEYENRGNVPVVFSDFMLMLPRLEGVLDESGEFVLHPGAELLIDKRPTTRVGGYQVLRKLDYRTNKVRLEPGEMHTDFFDLGAFFPDVEPGDSPWNQVSVPPDFHPVLSFHDNFGNRYYCDQDGVHRGDWEHPNLDALRAASGTTGYGTGVETKRRWLRWFGWKYDETHGTGEVSL